MILNNDKVDLLLRYSGGKYYALKQLGKFWLEKKHKKYVEPFFGGGSVFWTKPKASGSGKPIKPLKRPVLWTMPYSRAMMT